MAKINLESRFGLGDPVEITHGAFEGRKGMVMNIHFQTTLSLGSRQESGGPEQPIIYDVLYTFDGFARVPEEGLEKGKHYVHRNMFAVKKGQIIKRNGLSYVVTMGMSEHMVTGRRGYVVSCKRLKDDNSYDPKGEELFFKQEDYEAIEILGSMNLPSKGESQILI